MVEEEDVDTSEDKEIKDTEVSEKKPSKKGCWINNKKNPRANTSTQDTGADGKEKFEGASNDMKGYVFSIGRNQEDVHATTMTMLEIVVRIKSTASVASAVQDLKVKPKMLKLPDNQSCRS